MVVVCVGGESTVKRLLVESDRYFLAGDNSEYPQMEIEGDSESVIWGVVTYSVRRVR